jgi:leucyl aminopeptidase
MIPTVSLSGKAPTGSEEAVIVPMFKNSITLRGFIRRLDRMFNNEISRYLAEGHFDGSGGKTRLLPIRTDDSLCHVLLVGLGDRPKLNIEKTAMYAGTASGQIKNLKVKNAHLLLDLAPGGAGRVAFVRAFLKGYLLARYDFNLKTDSKDKKPKAESLIINAGREKAAFGQVVQQIKTIVERNVAVRDMVNAPANTMTPSDMATRAKTLAKASGCSCRVLNIKEIQSKKMGGILSVAKGSIQEPKLVVMQYNMNRSRRPLVCLVGKGVTFDSGGISLKPWENMNEMKGDMAGGAVVINTLAAAAILKLPVRLVGIVPCVENMPSSGALKPGDIIHTYAGKTIEVLSTDAEGRLILSDAITYAREFKPAVVVDMATLTGACLVALGTRIAGVIGNDQKYIQQLLRAGEASGEPVWQLPLDETFQDLVKGDITDYKNYSGRYASSITAAALLSEFAGDTPWLHIDIAGTFWAESSKISYHRKGGTGYGVDLLIRFLESFSTRTK